LQEFILNTNLPDKYIHRIKALDGHYLLELGKVDEVNNLLRDLEEVVNEKDNITKVEIDLIKASLTFTEGKLEETIGLVESAITLLKQTKTIFLSSKRLLNSNLLELKGKCLRNLGQLDEAIISLKKAIEIKEKLKVKYELAGPTNILAIVYAMKSEFDLALQLLNKCVNIYEEVDNNIQLIKISNNIGQLYNLKGDSENAYNSYQRALNLSNIESYDAFLGPINLNMGLYHFSKGELDKALSYYKESLPYSEKKGDKRGMGMAISNIGNVYEYTGDLDDASEYYSRALELFEEMNITPQIAVCLHNMGNVNQFKEEYEKALEYYNRSLTMFEELENYNSAAETYYNIIKVLIEQNKMADAQEIQNKLVMLNQAHDHKLINLITRMSEASILKMSERVIQKAKAQEILQNIANEEVINYEYTVTAMLDLCELLLIELRISENEVVLNEIKSILDKVASLADEELVQSTRTPLLIRVYMFQSKMALMDLNVNEARKTLKKAKKIAVEKGLLQQLEVITKEEESMDAEMNKLKELVDNNASWYDRLKQSKMADYLKEAQQIARAMD